MVMRTLKNAMPQWAINAIRHFRSTAENAQRFGGMTTRETFEAIYAEGRWGNSDQGFNSGSGSAGPHVEAYVEMIASFVKDRHIGTVVDLGCGDFQVGKKIVDRTSANYIGIDIARNVIAANTAAFAGPRVQFACMDVDVAEPPDGDLCLVRQVFQHLSNHEISRILKKLRKYPEVIVTEHVPTSPRAANRDKTHGPDTRLLAGSGVFVDQAPFAIPSTVLLDVPVDFSGVPAAIRSWQLHQHR